MMTGATTTGLDSGAEGEGEIVRARGLSRYRRPISAAFAAGPLHRRSVVRGNIFNSNGIHVAVVNGGEVFDLDVQKIYELKGNNLYRLSGELARKQTRGT